MKKDAQLPAKISVHPKGNDFYTSMPCLLPEEYDRFGIKIVSRIKGRKPALHSDILLYEASTGKLLSLMDADWITQMRTGAVAALAINTLQSTTAHTYAFVGLGSTADATLQCLLATLTNKPIHIKLLRYKDQAEAFIARHNDSRISWEITHTPEELISDSDVIVSAVTEMPNLFCTDTTLFRPGCLLVPIHTRGFQNCDTMFDRIVADDTAHVEKFQYFNQFRSFTELSDVLIGNAPARKTNQERIIAYNIGLGLHDIYFAHNIYERFTR
ncbi:MAG: ornithine cyclodeaminase [Paludibacter sp.]|nr:ornithine cyclodeaminase [Bacteroidales bacterium]MCM1069214.1 ornithine cyclodeaminase [Prevotella sp.]MCM1354366.1 ornithine cyclodeaminase [Bacteroides sp.]MCM1443174.1 ornithine cyclodeaminase [Muribaculum sp.]MCM1481769.1 ornithine cyclodeaminase [Paludibacter sp.]